MKNIFKFFLSVLTVFYILTPVKAFAEEFSYPAYATSNINNLTVKSAILINYNTNEVLYSFNDQKPLPPASITKLMVLYIIMEKIHNGELTWDKPITVSLNVQKINETQVYLRYGEQYSLREMVKAMLIPSANDAAVAIAENIAGSESAFTKLMNEKAQEIGLKKSHFINVTGLPTHTINDQYHYMSAYDIALLAKQLISKYPEVLEFTSQAHATFRNGRYPLTNTNPLLGTYLGADGLKTGMTDAAGYCLVATAKRNDLRLISVELGGGSLASRETNSRKLLDYGFNNFKYVDKVFVDGAEVNLTEKPEYIAGTVVGPLKDLAKVFQAEVAFYPEKGTIELTDKHNKVIFNVHSRDVMWNDKKYTLPQPVQIVNGETMVPIRFLTELFNSQISYDDMNRRINIVTQSGAQLQAQ